VPLWGPVSEAIATLRDRMPVIPRHGEDEESWLDPPVTGKELQVPFDSNGMTIEAGSVS
jgi:putative SOS response-associated peptidase YedK